MRTPDLLFIGIYKAGTTFLRGYFSQHPQITWTRHAHYFLRQQPDPGESYPPGPPPEPDAPVYVDMFEGVALGYSFTAAGAAADWASVGFDPDRPITGDLLVPDQAAIARRIRERVPQARILLVLRNQLEWLRSNYLHHMLFLAKDRRSFGNFLGTLEGKCALHAGLFDQTVDAYFSAFGRERVHVMLFEHLAADADAATAALCRFLDIGHAPCAVSAEERNAGKGVAAGNAIAILSRLGLKDDTIRRIGRATRPVAGLGARLMARDVISPEQAGMLRAFYAASNFRTQAATGLDLGAAGYPL
ncbi:MAG: sulfotransferase [Rhodocyclaceae bacterium]|nr:sulfotransferase [Rhodocyclaceae bacterium]